MLSILLCFMLSTSGFVITRYICSHHATVIILGDFSDECCGTEAVKNTFSCIPVKVNHCSTNKDKCCQIEKTYIRLAENFLSSENNEFTKEIKGYSASTSGEILPKADGLQFSGQHSNDITQGKIPRPKKYLLYHQVKVDPPLI